MLITVAVVAATVLLMLLWFADSLIYCRRFQFSIRSLLLFTLAVAIPCSWLANEIRWAKRQREVLTEIDTHYGKYLFPVGTYSYPVNKLGWPAYWPRRVFGDDFFVDVDYVFLSGPQVTDALLDHLKALPQLQKLTLLDCTKVTDVGLETLNGLSRLRELNLDGTTVTDECLKKLQQALPHCRISCYSSTMSR